VLKIRIRIHIGLDREIESLTTDVQEISKLGYIRHN
jgi:hypothetical protein